jgi:hypothetical protein
MNWLFEQPLVIAIAGIVVGIAIGVAWSSTGRKELLFALGAVVVFTIAGLIVERMVVTDREAIEQTLVEIARDVQSNDVRAVVRHIHPGAPEIVRQAEAEMPNYEFTECRITKVHTIDIDASAEPRSAIVEFNVIASGSFSQGDISVADTKIPRWVQLHMVREKDGRWTVQDYKHDVPQRMLSSDPVGDGMGY